MKIIGDLPFSYHSGILLQTAVNDTKAACRVNWENLETNWSARAAAIIKWRF
jgi:hypothetical protein